MFPYRGRGEGRGVKLTTWVFVCAAAAPLGCDDGARIELPGDAGLSSGEEPSGSTGGSGGSGGSKGTGGNASAAGATGEGPAAPVGSAAAANVAPGEEPAAATDGGTCWQLPVIDGARLLPASGKAALLAQGKIVGSNESATNGFVDLAVIVEAPAEGQWVELSFENTTAYRYVKYYGPGGSHGALAELELYAGDERLEGAAFGSAGALEPGSEFGNALDGDPSTSFEGPLPNDNYVGLDLGAGHELPAPVFEPPPGSVEPGTAVTLSAEPGVSLLYTTDGTDPLTSGQPFGDPITVEEGSLLIKAVALGDCALPSPAAQGVYSAGGASTGRPGSPSPVQSSLHIGNSLTDTIVNTLPALAAEGGVALDLNRYTIPGAGTWLYEQNPTGGFGVPDVQQALRTRAFDHVSLQPYSNMPCQPTPSSDGDDSDSGYLAMAWADAMTQNPNVQLWVYQQWPAPTDIVNCISGGGWTRGDWQPNAPSDWEDAVANELAYQEAVREALVAQFPDAPPPYIVPGGLALVNLKHAIEAGEVPGVADFFGTLFQAGGEDIHMTGAGAYFISLVFYGSMFQQSPEGLTNDSGGELTDEQAAAFQRVAWQTLESYPLSGIER